MSDLSDNFDHQKSLENLLLDQRRGVSSVSIDEEVADLMQFQRSFQVFLSFKYARQNVGIGCYGSA